MESSAIAARVEKIFKVAPNGKIYDEIRNPVGMMEFSKCSGLSNC